MGRGSWRRFLKYNGEAGQPPGLKDLTHHYEYCSRRCILIGPYNHISSSMHPCARRGAYVRQQQKEQPPPSLASGFSHGHWGDETDRRHMTGCMGKPKWQRPSAFFTCFDLEALLAKTLVAASTTGRCAIPDSRLENAKHGTGLRPGW